MKKITAALGTSHSEFDRQLKDILNDISEAIDNLTKNQDDIFENQHKLAHKQHVEVMQSTLCDTCKRKATFTTINITEGTYKSFCNKCLAT